MKRAIALVVAALLVLPLIGCGGGQVDPAAPPSGIGNNMFYVLWWLVGVVGSAIALFQAWQYSQWM